jgi:hypothetical protein
MDHKDYFIRSLTDFIFRRKHPALALVVGGLGVFSLVLAGVALKISIPTTEGVAYLSFSTDTAAGALTWVAVAVALVLIISGLTWLYNDWKQVDRRRVFAIEFRGLRDWQGAPLVYAIPPSVEGRRVEILKDLRQRVRDGHVVDPQAAVERLMTLRATLDDHEAGRDRADSTFVVGGLAPVPLSFLAGVLLDDESPMTFFDWDRDAKLWCELNRDDDGDRFVIDGLAGVPAGAHRVTVLISVSYAVDEISALRRVGPGPVVRLALSALTTNNHWSEGKQRALTRQFLDTMTALKGKGVGQIDLFLAGANSLVLRLGSVYDKRNLPPITVYQYEGNAFSWGVIIPVAGLSQAGVDLPAGS